jgi:hypothetical protein
MSMYNLAALLNKERKYAESELVLKQLLPLLLQRESPDEKEAKQAFVLQELATQQESIRSLDGQGKSSEAEAVAKQVIGHVEKLEVSTRASQLASLRTTSPSFETLIIA